MSNEWQHRIKALKNLQGIDKLIEIMAMLRDPKHGCPWDLKQSFKSIVPHTIEEAYEVAEAINSEDFSGLKKELGDLLFQVIFYSQLGSEQQLFDFHNVADVMCEKLIRRHPHVFADTDLADEQAIKQNWELTKAQERVEDDPKNTSALDDIPLALPALSRAYKIQKRAANVGFDWPDVTGALEKVQEEITEVQQELTPENGTVDNDKLADELGDLYFALTNVTRHLGLKPEQVVELANKKFEKRFRQVETLAKNNNQQLSEMSLDAMEDLWQQAKKTD